MTAAPPIAEVLQQMLRDLLECRFEVCKIPGKYGGYVRVVVSQNAPWYQELCSRYLSRRRRYPKMRTVIRRANTVKALKRMIRQKDRDTVYAQRILAVIEDGYGVP